MKFEDSKYYNNKTFKKIVLKMGVLYISEDYCVSEINEGIQIGIEESQEVIMNLVNFYGENLIIGFVSNRINSYSINLREWLKLTNNDNFVINTAIVVYDDLNYNAATIEKELTKNSLRRFHTLNEAIQWIINLK